MNSSFSNHKEKYAYVRYGLKKQNKTLFHVWKVDLAVFLHSKHVLQAHTLLPQHMKTMA